MIWGLHDLMIQIVSRHGSKWLISRPNVSRNNYGDHSSGVRDRGAPGFNTVENKESCHI